MIYDLAVVYVFLLRTLNAILPREDWGPDYPCK